MRSYAMRAIQETFSVSYKPGIRRTPRPSASLPHGTYRFPLPPMLRKESKQDDVIFKLYFVKTCPNDRIFNNCKRGT